MPNDKSCDRRALLGAAAASGLVLLAGDLVLPQRAFADEEEVLPDEDMMREHGVLRRILILYAELVPALREHPATVDAKALHDAASLFQQFGEQYHEQKLEEEHVFPALRKAGGQAGGLVDVLLRQHARGREITDFVLGATGGAKISDGAELARALHSFVRMYEAHAAWEDTVIFPAFKKSMSKKRFEELGEQFEKIEHQQFGTDGFDMAVRRVAQIETALGFGDLDKFTAPPVKQHG